MSKRYKMAINKLENRTECKNVRVTTAAGKVYDLGNPKSVWFPLRVWIYKIRRKINA